MVLARCSFFLSIFLSSSLRENEQLSPRVGYFSPEGADCDGAACFELNQFHLFKVLRYKVSKSSVRCVLNYLTEQHSILLNQLILDLRKREKIYFPIASSEFSPVGL